MTGSRNGPSSAATTPALRSLLVSNSKERPRSAIFWVLGLIICYQFCYQLVMHKVLDQEKEAWEICTADSGVSPQCQENRLFRSWQVDTDLAGESEEHLQGLLSAEEAKDNVPLHPPPQHVTVSNDATETIENNETEMTSWGKSLIAQQETFESQMETLKEGRNVTALTPWAKSLVAQQAKMEAMRPQTTEAPLTPWANGLVAQQKQWETRMEALKQRDSLTPWAKDLIATQMHMESKLQELNSARKKRMEQADATHKKRSHVTAWAKHLGAVQESLEAKKKELDARRPVIKPTPPKEKTLMERIADLGRQMCLEPQRSGRPSCKQFLTGKDALVAKPSATHLRGTKPPAIQEAAEKVAAVLHSNSWNNMTEWGKDLVYLQEHFEFRMRLRTARSTNKSEMALNQASILDAHLKELAERRRSLEKAALEQIKSLQDLADGKRSWEKATVKQIRAFGQELCADPARRDYAACVQFRTTEESKLDKAAKDLANEKHAWETATVKQIHAFGQELCADPARRDYTACAQFRTKSENTVDKVALETQIRAFGQELCADPARRDYAACVQFRTNSENNVELPSVHLGNLNWPAVTAWKNLPHSGTAKILGGQELRQERWSGRIPKVACITVIPDDAKVEAWLGFFIDNFRSQTYEGPTQLILVYHYQNAEAAQLVKTFADGVYIRGAATRDANFPSASSFRYGAWLSDADVVARWDFDEWHHTERLAMQVRALALTKRPVSVLPRWTVRKMNAHVHTVDFEGVKSERTIVGEAKWMQELWYPDVQEESAPSIFRAYQLVKVDMPELMTQDEALQDLALIRLNASS